MADALRLKIQVVWQLLTNRRLEPRRSPEASASDQRLVKPSESKVRRSQRNVQDCVEVLE